MLHLTFAKLSSTFAAHKFLTVIIILSIAASFFCVNSMLGCAEDSYRSSYDATIFTTLCVSGHSDADIDQMRSFISDECGYAVGSTLSFAKCDDFYLIGFDGTDASEKWFTCLSGSFFTDDAAFSLSDNVYLSFELSSYIDDSDTFTIDGHTYNVIGYGGIVSVNFRAAMGDIYSSFFTDGNIYSDNIYVISENSFNKYGYNADVVLIHINGVSYKQLEALLSDLESRFPAVQITIPSYNSDQYRLDEKLSTVPVSAFFVILIGASLLSMAYVWLDETKDISHIYIICGLSRAKTVIISVAELLFLTFLGEALALIVQYLALPWLSLLGAGYMPGLQDIILTFIIASSALVLLLFGRIIKNLDIGRGELT
ncbi:MAG: hypothetical protein LUE25_04985 [Clostridiales bacterium]|nr:hypothetical protein [Clostridiales bacterium]